MSRCGSGREGLVVLRVPEDRKFIRLFAVSLSEIGVDFTRAEGRMGEGQRDILLTARFAGLEPAAAELLSACVNNPKVGLFLGLFIVIRDNVDAGRAAEVKGAREVTRFSFRYINAYEKSDLGRPLNPATPPCERSTLSIFSFKFPVL